MLNKKGAAASPWGIIWIIVFVGVVLVGVYWSINYISTSRQLTVTGPTGATAAGAGQDVGPGKLTATLAFTTDERFAIGTQPACQNSLYIKDRITGQYNRVRNDITEGGTKAVTPGDVVTVYYCSNTSAALAKGWYGGLDKDILIGNTGSYEFHNEDCQWQTNTLSTTVTNQGGGSTNPGTTQAISSGGSATVHVTSTVPGNRCFSIPESDAFIDLVGFYNATAFQEVTLKNVVVYRNGAGTLNLGTIRAGSGLTPVQSKFTVRRTKDAVASYKIPTYLANGDRLEYDIFIQAQSGQDPAAGGADSANINMTYFDTDYYPDTYTGAWRGPSIEDNTGVDLGNSLYLSNVTIGIT